MKRKVEFGTNYDQSSSGINEKCAKLNSVIEKNYIKNGIYFTKIKGLSDKTNENTFSLFELINKINPIVSIHFNYCIDPNFLIR